MLTKQQIDKTKTVSLTVEGLDKIIKDTYRVAFFDGAKYMIDRNHGDTPESTGYYHPPVTDLHRRLIHNEHLNEKLKIFE